MQISFEKIAPPEHASLISETWSVLAAAKDLADVPTQLICRRVIEMHLDGKQPLEADADVVRKYFG